MAAFGDLHGDPVEVGTVAKLSGGYADSAVPTYMIHERVEVVRLGRTRVWVKLLSRDYAGRPPLSVLPRTLVIERPR